MSASIDIFPVEILDFTFDQVIKLSQHNLDAFLDSIDVHKQVKLKAKLYDKKGTLKPFSLDDRFQWDVEDETLMFSLENVYGVLEAYNEPIKEPGCPNPWWPLDVIIQPQNPIEDVESKVEKIKRLNWYWYIRCQWSNPSIMYLTCGMIAAAIAELSSGLIYTDDAWDPRHFPATYTEFLDFYYRKSKGTWFYKIAKESPNEIREELKHLPEK